MPTYHVSYGSNVGELVAVDVSFSNQPVNSIAPLTAFLGNSGRILLQRKGTDRPWYTAVDPLMYALTSIDSLLTLRMSSSSLVTDWR